MSTYLVLDANDRIVEVGGQWDAFALENEAPHLAGRAVIGTSLMDHIIGTETRMFLQALLQRARLLQRPKVVPYRCDSATLKRFMCMEIRPSIDGTLRIEHRQLYTEPYAVPLRLASADNRSLLPRCSMCNRLRIGTQWMDPGIAGTSLPSSAERRLPVHECMCPDCRRLGQLVGTRGEDQSQT